MKDIREHERIHTRKIDRAVAHKRMKDEGIAHMNRSERGTYMTVSGAVMQKVEPSYFAKNWRAYSYD